MTDLLKKHSVPEKCLNMKFTDDLLILLTLQIQNMEGIAPHLVCLKMIFSKINRWRDIRGWWVEGKKAGRRSYMSILSNRLLAIYYNIFHPSVAVTVPFNPVTYPSWSRLSESDKKVTVVRNCLKRENRQVRDHFAQMLNSIQSSFRGVDHVEVLNYLILKRDTEHIDLANKGCDWLNYHLLDILVREFGSMELR